jgi:hypothetical protein
MRATLDIDDDVLDAVRRMADAERRTPGQVLSDLARRSIARSASTAPDAAPPVVERNGWIVLAGRTGTISAEQVDDLLRDAI